MTKFLLITLFLLLSLTSFVYADQTCYVSQECIFETVVLNGSTYYNGTVTNSLFKGSDTVYLSQSMTKVTKDTTKISYTYNYTFNESGTYLRESVALGIPINEQVLVEDFSLEHSLGFTLWNSMLLGFILILVILGIVLRFFKK